MSSDKQAASAAASPEPDDLFDDIKEELTASRKTLISESRETIVGLLNSIFGDFRLFWSVIKTIGVWFVKPVSLNVRQVELENKKRVRAEQKPQYFTDLGLMKSLFMLSLTFLVFEEAVIGGPENAWKMKLLFFLFFIGLFFAFIILMWLWKILTFMDVPDTRVFMGYVIYQYASIYIVNFILNGPLGLDTYNFNADFNWLYIAYFLPIAHFWYFAIKLMRHYQQTPFKMVWGFLLGTVIVGSIQAFVPAVTHIFFIGSL